MVIIGSIPILWHRYNICSNKISIQFLSDSFLSVSDGYRETIETKIWYSLLEKGYSEFAVAGIMGNLSQKSNFQIPSLIPPQPNAAQSGP